MHRFNWRTASRVCAGAFIATACTSATAAAQTPTPTPAPAPIEIPTTGAPITPNGTDNAPTPGTNECYARLFKPKDVPASFGGEGTVVAQYRLRCSSDVTGFTFGFNRPVLSAETELFPTLLASNAVIPDESFNCAGDFPGWGLTCTGV